MLVRELRRTVGASAEPVRDGIAALASETPAITSKRAFAQCLDRLSAQLLREHAYPTTTFAKLLILRVSNLLLGKFHTHHAHTSLLGRPFQILIDPANTCQLKCPGCVHSPLAAERGKTSGDFFLWPKGQLSEAYYRKIVRQFSPFAFATIFYNYGEPLINRRFPAMVSEAKALHHFTHASSNLSLSFDIDAVVNSGLDLLTMSIDGASQETLGLYRRGARWDLCQANMRALVDSKRRSKSPIRLSWQFLVFEHNAHEVSAAIDLAREIGVDEICVNTPFDVSWDDPTVRIGTSPLLGRHVLLESPAPEYRPETLVPFKDDIDALYDEGWCARLGRLGVEEEKSRAGETSCEWLYQNITIDSAGRTLPCCAPPATTKHLVFGSIDDAQDAVNTPDARLSRLLFADRAAYEAAMHDQPRKPYCEACPKPPPHQYRKDVQLVQALRNIGGPLLSDAAVQALTSW